MTVRDGTSAEPVGGSAIVPAYDELPYLGNSDVREAWKVWGQHDRLGTMNRVTTQTVLEALRLPTQGSRFSLDLPLGAIDPPLYGRRQFAHRVFDRNRNMVEDEINYIDPQGSSQWDSLRHIRAGRSGHFGGLAAEDEQVRQLGIDALVRLGLVLRGVLLNFPRYWEASGQSVDPHGEHSIGVQELRDCARAQGSAWQAGDLLIVRTGFLAAYRERGGVGEENLAMPTSAGLDASADMARFLWDQGFSAVAADNPAVEVLPGDAAVGSLHRRLIPGLGMPLGELWDLDELADACEADRRYECCVVSVPLRVVGGVASPANVMAIR
jgi:kynurenine formamidase